MPHSDPARAARVPDQSGPLLKGRVLKVRLYVTLPLIHPYVTYGLCITPLQGTVHKVRISSPMYHSCYHPYAAEEGAQGAHIHLEVINVSFLCHHPYGVTPMLQGTVLKVSLKGRV